MDENGDAEGNYTLLARQLHRSMPDEYALYPVGLFVLNDNGSRLPVSTRYLLSAANITFLQTDNSVV